MFKSRAGFFVFALLISIVLRACEDAARAEDDLGEEVTIEVLDGATLVWQGDRLLDASIDENLTLAVFDDLFVICDQDDQLVAAGQLAAGSKLFSNPDEPGVEEASSSSGGDCTEVEPLLELLQYEEGPPGDDPPSEGDEYATGGADPLVYHNSRDGAGTTFTITFPDGLPTAPGECRVVTSNGPPGGKYTSTAEHKGTVYLDKNGKWWMEYSTECDGARVHVEIRGIGGYSVMVKINSNGYEIERRFFRHRK